MKKAGFHQKPETLTDLSFPMKLSPPRDRSVGSMEMR
uniref:Uncharacterized protein n=1 Tax=Anguilla anguilla TaxID=7936 RepID=A0A0E9QSG2_ANGAN